MSILPDPKPVIEEAGQETQAVALAVVDRVFDRIDSLVGRLFSARIVIDIQERKP